MKTGLATSVVMHAALLGFGLFSLSAPKAFDAADVEALPVEIVSISQFQQGDKKAPVSEKPAPKPTQRPDVVPDAQKVGENDIDTDKPVTPEAKPKPVETADARAPSPKPVEKVKQEEAPKPIEKPKPVAATEVTPSAKPRQEVEPEPVKTAEPKAEPAPKPEQKVAAAEPVKPDTVAETIVQEEAKPAEESAQLPVSAPAPEARPQPAEAQTAKAPDRKSSEKPVKEASSKAQSDETGSIEEQVAALLNKEKASGGGAKRSTEQAALGGKKTNGAKLSQGEMDALRSQLGNCWNIPAGIEQPEGLRVSVRFSVDPSGKLEGAPAIDTSSGNRIFDESAVRAVRKCDRDGLNLPADKPEVWADVIVNFEPSEMF
jgi:colicin import membrane protein